MTPYLAVMDMETSFHHVIRLGDVNKRPLLLLHGTGGNEHDLLDLAQAVAPGRSVISPRGRVLEHGMPRFFRRFAEGRFDEDDLRLRAGELASFVAAASAANGLKQPLALGFSNGANMAAGLLALHPAVLAGAALLRAMAPFKDMPLADVTAKPVLLLSGSADPMIPKADTLRLADWLRNNGATLSHQTWPAGHGLVNQDIAALTAFFETQD